MISKARKDEIDDLTVLIHLSAIITSAIGIMIVVLKKKKRRLQ